MELLLLGIKNAQFIRPDFTSLTCQETRAPLLIRPQPASHVVLPTEGASPLASAGVSAISNEARPSRRHFIAVPRACLLIATGRGSFFCCGKARRVGLQLRLKVQSPSCKNQAGGRWPLMPNASIKRKPPLGRCNTMPAPHLSRWSV